MFKKILLSFCFLLSGCSYVDKDTLSKEVGELTHETSSAVLKGTEESMLDKGSDEKISEGAQKRVAQAGVKAAEGISSNVEGIVEKDASARMSNMVSNLF